MTIAAGLRNWRRAREILSVLVWDYGFGYVLDQLDLWGVLPLGRRREVPPERIALSGPQRLRLALAQLGPTFIKLGQVLSARADLLPPAYVAELRRLQDQAPPVPFEQIRGVAEAELGRPLEQVFARFDPIPLSSASLGQVHAATLPDGREVTVKVLKPGVARVVEGDLQLLADAAQVLTRQVPALQRYDLPGFVRRFAGQLEDELVYTLEAENARRIGESLRAAGLRVRVPRVIGELTTKRVLCTERVWGRRVDELAGEPVAAPRREAAEQFARAMLIQIFRDGFFHADPHQGNVWLADDGWVVLLDFGMVGYLDPGARRSLAQVLGDALAGDVEGLVERLSQLGAVAGDTDLLSLRAELSRLVSRFVGLSRRELAMGELLSRTLRTLWVHQVRVPPDFSVAAKALLLTEAVCSELDPEFDLRAAARPLVEEELARLAAPKALGDRVWRVGGRLAGQVLRLPGRAERVLGLLESGSLKLRIEDPRATEWMTTLGRSLNRLALSALSAGLLVSGAIYLTASKPGWQWWLGGAAVAGGVFLGLVVVAALLRPGRL